MFVFFSSGSWYRRALACAGSRGAHFRRRCRWRRRCPPRRRQDRPDCRQPETVACPSSNCTVTVTREDSDPTSDNPAPPDRQPEASRSCPVIGGPGFGDATPGRRPRPLMPPRRQCRGEGIFGAVSGAGSGAALCGLRLAAGAGRFGRLAGRRLTSTAPEGSSASVTISAPLRAGRRPRSLVSTTSAVSASSLDSARLPWPRAGPRAGLDRVGADDFGRPRHRPLGPSITLTEAAPRAGGAAIGDLGRRVHRGFGQGFGRGCSATGSGNCSGSARLRVAASLRAGAGRRSPDRAQGPACLRPSSVQTLRPRRH